MVAPAGGPSAGGGRSSPNTAATAISAAIPEAATHRAGDLKGKRDHAARELDPAAVAGSSAGWPPFGTSAAPGGGGTPAVSAACGSSKDGAALRPEYCAGV